MATHSSIPAWTIPWTEELGGPQSMGSQRVGHDSDILKKPKHSVYEMSLSLNNLLLTYHFVSH